VEPAVISDTVATSDHLTFRALVLVRVPGDRIKAYVFLLETMNIDLRPNLLFDLTRIITPAKAITARSTFLHSPFHMTREAYAASAGWLRVQATMRRVWRRPCATICAPG
jgi:hypothetical protein